MFFFPYLWTIIHPVDEASPLKGLIQDQTLEGGAEILVTINAFDDSFSQTEYFRSSHKPYGLKWGEKFVYIVEQEKNGIKIDIGRIDETLKTDLNPL